jgi:excisionase family DNA binding protein
MATNIQRYLTTNEVAEILRTPAETIRFWRARGKGPRATKVGRRLLFAEADVADWLAQQARRDEVAARAER